MKKQKKAKLNFRSKVKGFRLGDRVFVNYLIFTGATNRDGIIEDIGSNYIVIDRYLIHNYELINLQRI
jgi:hypothetical protein